MGKQKSGKAKKEQKAKKRKARLKNQKIAKIQAGKMAQIRETIDEALELAENGKREKADRILSQLQKKYPGSESVHFGLGVAALFAQDWETSISHFKKAAHINPEFIHARFNLAMAYKKSLRIFEMIREFQAVVKLEAHDPKLAGEAKKVLNDMERMLQRQDNISLERFMEAHELFNEGFDHMSESRLEQAIERFKQAREINPKSPQTHGNLGICYARLGDRKKALEELDKALAIDPDYEPALINKAVFEKMKDGEVPNFPEFDLEYYREKVLREKGK